MSEQQADTAKFIHCTDEAGHWLWSQPVGADGLWQVEECRRFGGQWYMAVAIRYVADWQYVTLRRV